jgi:hypothetical protein
MYFTYTTAATSALAHPIYRSTAALMPQSRTPPRRLLHPPASILHLPRRGCIWLSPVGWRGRDWLGLSTPPGGIMGLIEIWIGLDITLDICAD